MAEPTPDRKNRSRSGSKYVNTLVWVAIGFIAALIAAWTVWASRQPQFGSIWGSD